MPADPIISGMDRLASRVVDAMHRLFGFQYSRNSEHYVYHTSITTGATDVVGTAYTGAIRVTQEADFICTRLNANARILTTGILIGTSSANGGAAGDTPDAPFTLLITDGSTDRQLSSEAVDVGLVYGAQGGLPGVWARPRLFARNTTVTLRLTSLKVPLAAWVYRIALIGWKVYDVQSLDNTSRQARPAS